MKKVLVAGGRDFDDYNLLTNTLADILWLEPEGIEIIEGGARGADRMAQQWAIAVGVPFTTVNADWDKYKKAAGPIRNIEMAKMKPDLVVLFPGGAGTNHMYETAKKYGLSILDYRNGADNEEWTKFYGL